jgi:hypothetical protein
LQCLGERIQQQRPFTRFLELRRCSKAKSQSAYFWCRLCGHHQHREIRPGLANRLENSEPVQIRKPDIQKDRAGVAIAGRSQTGLPGGCLMNAIAGTLEEPLTPSTGTACHHQ